VPGRHLTVCLENLPLDHLKLDRQGLQALTRRCRYAIIGTCSDALEKDLQTVAADTGNTVGGEADLTSKENIYDLRTMVS
jgi:hypothetical protein